MQANDIPLIYTSRGNVPIDSVRQVVLWEQHDDMTLFIEEYHALDNGDVIKRSVHGLAKHGLGAIGVQSELG